MKCNGKKGACSFCEPWKQCEQSSRKKCELGTNMNQKNNQNKIKNR